MREEAVVDRRVGLMRQHAPSVASDPFPRRTRPIGHPIRTRRRIWVAIARVNQQRRAVGKHEQRHVPPPRADLVDVKNPWGPGGQRLSDGQRAGSPPSETFPRKRVGERRCVRADSHDPHFHLGVQHLEKLEHFVAGFPVVGRVQKAV